MTSASIILSTYAALISTLAFLLSVRKALFDEPRIKVRLSFDMLFLNTSASGVKSFSQAPTWIRFDNVGKGDVEIQTIEFKGNNVGSGYFIIPSSTSFNIPLVEDSTHHEQLPHSATKNLLQIPWWNLRVCACTRKGIFWSPYQDKEPKGYNGPEAPRFIETRNKILNKIMFWS